MNDIVKSLKEWDNIAKRKGILQRVHPSFIRLNKTIAPSMSVNKFSEWVTRTVNGERYGMKKIIILKKNQEEALYGRVKKK